MADKLAKEATRGECQLKIPSNDYRKEFKETAYKDTVSEIKIQAAVKVNFTFNISLKRRKDIPGFKV